MVDTSRAFTCLWSFEQPKGEHHSGQVSEQRDTASADQSEQVIRHLEQEIETPRTPYFCPRIRTLIGLEQAILLLKITGQNNWIPAPCGTFWKKSWPRHASVFLSGHPGSSWTFPKSSDLWTLLTTKNTHTPCKITILKYNSLISVSCWLLNYPVLLSVGESKSSAIRVRLADDSP